MQSKSVAMMWLSHLKTAVDFLQRFQHVKLTSASLILQILHHCCSVLHQAAGHPLQTLRCKSLKPQTPCLAAPGDLHDAHQEHLWFNLFV